jgi:hypothetical protein
MVYMVKLSDERGEQLRQIAEAKKLSVADLIAEYIRSEIAANTIPGDIPGVALSSDAGEIKIVTRDGFEVSIPANEGPTLGDVLRDAANVSDDPERKKRWVEGLAALSGVRVTRTGPNSLKLTSPLTGREYSLPLNVAADLGDEIEKTARHLSKEIL